MGCREDRGSRPWEKVLLGELRLRLCSGLQAQQPLAGTCGWDTHCWDRTTLPPDVSYLLSIWSYQLESFPLGTPLSHPPVSVPGFAPQPSLWATTLPRPCGVKNREILHTFFSIQLKCRLMQGSRGAEQLLLAIMATSLPRTRNTRLFSGHWILGGWWRWGVDLPHLARHHSRHLSSDWCPMKQLVTITPGLSTYDSCKDRSKQSAVCCSHRKRRKGQLKKIIKFDLNPDTHPTTACTSYSLTIGSRRRLQ